MKQVTASEILWMNKLLMMETNSLAMARAGSNAIADSQLKSLVDAGIASGEARIKGIQQFINDNNITVAGGTD